MSNRCPRKIENRLTPIQQKYENDMLKVGTNRPKCWYGSRTQNSYLLLPRHLTPTSHKTNKVRKMGGNGTAILFMVKDCQ